jgi:hypothetical protein
VPAVLHDEPSRGPCAKPAVPCEPPAGLTSPISGWIAPYAADAQGPSSTPATPTPSPCRVLALLGLGLASLRSERPAIQLYPLIRVEPCRHGLRPAPWRLARVAGEAESGFRGAGSENLFSNHESSERYQKRDNVQRLLEHTTSLYTVFTVLRSLKCHARDKSECECEYTSTCPCPCSRVQRAVPSPALLALLHVMSRGDSSARCCCGCVACYPVSRTGGKDDHMARYTISAGPACSKGSCSSCS